MAEEQYAVSIARAYNVGTNEDVVTTVSIQPSRTICTDEDLLMIAVALAMSNYDSVERAWRAAELSAWFMSSWNRRGAAPD